MIRLKKILVPTDLSENAAMAYQPAQQIASYFGATVDFIHVIPTSHYFSEKMETIDLPLNRAKYLYSRIHQQSSSELNELMDNFLDDKSKGDVIVKVAPKPEKMVLEHATRMGYDMIIMGEKGQQDSNFFRGSITERVMRFAEIPVLVTNTSNFNNVKNILTPTDGSKASLEIMLPAISLALAFDASITMLYVVALQWGPVRGSLQSSADKMVRNNILALLKDLFEHSDDNIELQKGEGFESQIIYKHGTTKLILNLKAIVEEGISKTDSIVKYAAKHADLIAMTTHGRSGMAHFFIGSITEMVSRRTGIPTLTLKTDF
ncbi:MAG TPA: universal stress protein [Balneolaceae bacterium]|nr:universal stress protein [Balneolaceae bacterium]